MRFLLRLKHWQLFLVIWTVPFLLVIFPRIGINFRAISLVNSLFFLINFAWIWAIGTEFHKRLPVEVDLKLAPFKLSMILFIANFIFLQLWINSGLFTNGNSLGGDLGMNAIIVVMIVQVISVVMILMSIRFAAKTLRSCELGRLAKFPDYSAEFFQICVSPFGIWGLQPRLNKLTDPIIQ